MFERRNATGLPDTDWKTIPQSHGTIEIAIPEGINGRYNTAREGGGVTPLYHSGCPSSVPCLGYLNRSNIIWQFYGYQSIQNLVK